MFKRLLTRRKKKMEPIYKEWDCNKEGHHKWVRWGSDDDYETVCEECGKYLTRMNNPFIIGERLYLRALRPEDADGPWVSWFNDAEVCAGNSHHVRPYTRQDALDYIFNTEDLALAIVDMGTDKHIGNVTLQNIHPINRSADFGIIIGDKSFWGKGYGKEAATLMFDHGFKTMNLHRIACGTLETNQAMMKLASSLGMQFEGLRIQAVFKDGMYIDIKEYRMLRKDWNAK